MDGILDKIQKKKKNKLVSPDQELANEDLARHLSLLIKLCGNMATHLCLSIVCGY